MTEINEPSIASGPPPDHAAKDRDQHTASFIPKMRVSQLNFYYGLQQRLHCVSVDIAEKKITALIGPSGCGKTTFLRTLNRKYETVPRARADGQVLLDGNDIFDMEVASLRRRVGMVFQKSNPFPKTIFENIAYGLRMNGWNRKSTLEELVEASLRRAGLWDEVKDVLSAMDLPAGIYTIEASAPGFAKATRAGVQLAAGGAQDITISLSVAPLNREVTVEGAIAESVASQWAPSENTLDATSAKTEISGSYIRNFISPVADFAEAVDIVPGAFSINPNGVGLGQGKMFCRGFADPKYSMTFDGIPFEDTNDGSHHSWSFFPGPRSGSPVR